MGTKISDLPVTGVLPADAVFPLEYSGANYSVKASDLSSNKGVTAMVSAQRIWSGNRNTLSFVLDLNDHENWNYFDHTGGTPTTNSSGTRQHFGTFDPDGGPIAVQVSYAEPNYPDGDGNVHGLDYIETHVTDTAVGGDQTKVEIHSVMSPSEGSDDDGTSMAAYVNIIAFQISDVGGGSGGSWSSGWQQSFGGVPVANEATLPITHNLGTTDVIVKAYINTSTGSDNGAHELTSGGGVTSDMVWEYGAQVKDLTSNGLILQLSEDGFLGYEADGGIEAVTSFENCHLKVVVISAGGSSSSGTTSAILPFAHARIFTNNAGTGIGMSWGAYDGDPGQGYVQVTFDTPQPDTDYYVVTDRERYDQHLIDVDQKTTSGFRTKWVNNDGSLVPPGTFGGMLTVYGSTPTIDIGGGSSSSSSSEISFRAHRDGVVQSISGNGVSYQVEFTTTDFNKGDKFDVSTHRFTPGVAGRYMLNAGVAFDNIAANKMVNLRIRKNGLEIVDQVVVTTGNYVDPTLEVSSLVEAGVDDYFDIIVKQFDGSPRNLKGGSWESWFDGHLIGGSSSSGGPRAYVAFDGTAGDLTASITKSFNVDSITDNAVGDYTVNLTNAVTDAVTVASSQRIGGNISSDNHSVLYPEVTSSTEIRVYCHGADANGNLGSNTDAAVVNLVVF